MPITLNGYTKRQIAEAIQSVILLADPDAFVKSHITLTFKNDDETLNASTDYVTHNVNRWDIHDYNGGNQRTTEPLNCDGVLKIGRKKVTNFLLKFRYSVGVDEDEKDDQDKISYDRFCDREEAVELQISVTPDLGLTGVLHNELQVDRRAIESFRREQCFEGSYRLQVTHRDTVTKTE